MYDPIPFRRFRGFGVSSEWSGKRRIVGAGLKMYLGYGETIEWLGSLREHIQELDNVGVFVLPSFLALAAARDLLGQTPILYGSQNAHWEVKGPYTGEVSPAALRELGCTLVEIGHAERRVMFGETDRWVNLKVAEVLRQGMIPLICIGEHERQSVQRTIDEMRHQVRTALDSAKHDQECGVREDLSDAIIVAYEPIWAIGAETSAPSEHIFPIIAAIRSELSCLWPGSNAILYGGSVDSDDAAGIFETGIDGLFVGRSALDLEEFTTIVKVVASNGRAEHGGSPETANSGPEVGRPPQDVA
jgi:triosephosphate isomerase